MIINLYVDSSTGEGSNIAEQQRNTSDKFLMKF